MEEKNYITVAYKLYAIEDGEKDLIEEAKAEHPFQFISGLGITLDAFEKQISGLKKGDKFDFTILSADAYGDYEEDYIIELPKNLFEIDGKFDAETITEGNTVPLMAADGRHLTGTVVEVKEEVVVMDMNHPLSGADLHFIGEVIENREAKGEEIKDMLHMMAKGECNCGCDECEDGGHCH